MMIAPYLCNGQELSATTITDGFWVIACKVRGFKDS